MRKFLLAIVALVLFSFAGHSDKLKNQKIEKSIYPEGIPSKLVLRTENGKEYTEDIVISDLDETEIEELYMYLDDYLNDNKFHYDEYFEKAKRVKTAVNDEEADEEQIPVKQITTGLYLSAPVYAKGREGAIKKMPVLSQGSTDTCVTFSSTAAVDIVTAGGTDKYSVFRSLLLGKAIAEKKVNKPAGVPEAYEFKNPWDGAHAPCLIGQYKEYGLVEDCGKIEDSSVRQSGFDAKVANDKLKSKSLKTTQLPEYKKIDNLSYSIILDKDTDIREKYSTESERQTKYIKAIKDALDKGNVVLIGLDMLSGVESPQGFWNGNGQGATVILKNNGQFSIDLSKQKDTDSYNTWDNFKELAIALRNPKNRQNAGGHEMLIIGYCDNPKLPGKGVFILRNSWGKDNGISGNNFATYDYTYTFGDDPVAVGTK